MPIQPALLNKPVNRFLRAAHDNALRRVLRELRAAGGDDDWHIVFRGGDGQWRAVMARALLERAAADEQALYLTLSDCGIPPARVADRDEMGSEDAQALARQQPDKVLVVTTDDGETLLGVVYEGRRRGGDGPRLLTTINLGQGHKPPLESSPPGGDGGQPTRTFEAWPDLQVPGPVEPEREFKVTVGFRDQRDDTQTESRRVRVENVTAETRLWVMLVAEGAEVLGTAQQPLALDMNATAEFTCRSKPGVNWVTLTVQYWHNAQMVGMARRVAPVAAANVYPIPSSPMPRPNPCRVNFGAAGAGTDLQVTIQATRDGQLHWTFVAPNPPLQVGPVATPLADAREFAGGIISDLRTQGFAGVFAARILENIGQDIADIMPHEFFESLEKVHAAIGRPPTVLLYTNEPYVPWELALLPRKLDPALPGYLGMQAVVGRWLLDENVVYPPPAVLDVKRITAVAVDYDLNSGLRQLQFALDEQKMMVTRHRAAAVPAQRERLEPLVEPPQAGHLIHFAVHGVSDPRANEEALLLGDGTRLVARALSGAYDCGGAPPFAFVFLNACQVGTAGSAFGQAAGFPGDLVRGGVAGFVAPLWEVDDQAAAELAEKFYEATLNNNTPPAAALREARLTYDRKKHTTPLAYIFYGHPALRLTKGLLP